MDNLRGFDPFSPEQLPDDAGYASFDEDMSDQEDAAIEAPPSISGDERRMQVRAYNFWTSQLGDRNYPPIEDLDPESVEDFREFSVVLDFTSGIENPSIQFLGESLRVACDLAEDITYLDQVPPRSLLSRITDHYLQIIANKAPIGFEAEFTNEVGITFMYRGILLPYSSDDDTIDFIYGVINWKEVAADELNQLLHAEVESALADIEMQPRIEHVPVWADSPTAQDFDGVAEGASALFADELTLDNSFAGFDEPEPDESSTLADWLVAARNCADHAIEEDQRSRETLYKAIGRAYDFSIAAQRNPEDYNELLAESGMSVQERAPMTPVVKLVFGAAYDKTRLTEFAAALTYAHRNCVEQGELSALISKYDGGLKGIVSAERRYKKVAKGEHIAPVSDNRSKLREAPARAIDDFANGPEEFVVLVARREADGSVSLVGTIEDAALTEKVLGKTVI